MEGYDLAALVHRPAIRRFDVDRTVAAETVVALVDAARWTGSARNRQPWRFVQVRRRETLRELSLLGAYAQFIADAPVAVVIASAENGFLDTEYDVGRVTQSLVLAAAADGLACCPATLFPQANVASAARLLGLSPGWSPRHVLGLGYPAPRLPRSVLTGASAVPRGRLEVADLLTTID
jgi:nitroreductase